MSLSLSLSITASSGCSFQPQNSPSFSSVQFQKASRWCEAHKQGGGQSRCGCSGEYMLCLWVFGGGGSYSGGYLFRLQVKIEWVCDGLVVEIALGLQWRLRWGQQISGGFDGLWLLMVVMMIVIDSGGGRWWLLWLYFFGF